jgi:subtilisin family serine protease
MKKLLLYVAAVLLPIGGGYVGSLSAEDPLRLPPHNVSNDPAGTVPPEIGLLPGETVEQILQAEKVSIKSGEDTIDWSVKSVNAPAAWEKGLTGKDVKVVVLDTGSSNHRDLKDGIKGSRDFTGEGVSDQNGHSTHCLGSIGARKNGWGVIGVAYDCDLFAGKVLSNRGSGRVDWIRDGILWATNVVKADVISLSLGSSSSDDFIPGALLAAEQAGVIVVAATGNDGNGRPVNFPAAYQQPVAVGAVDVGLKLAPFSCTGAKVEAVGPGVKVRSTYPGPGDGLFADLKGTSMATPNVAGVATLWVQANQQIAKKDRPAAFRRWLAANCRDLGTPGRDQNFGWGIPDAGKLTVAGQPPVQPPQPPVMPLPGIIIDDTDLNEKGKDKLKKGGFEKFKFELQPPAGNPPAKEVPKLSLAALTAELKKLGPGGSMVVFVGVPADAAFPDAVMLSEELEGIPPGVYKTRILEKVGFSPLGD